MAPRSRSTDIDDEIVNIRFNNDQCERPSGAIDNCGSNNSTLVKSRLSNRNPPPLNTILRRDTAVGRRSCLNLLIQKDQIKIIKCSLDSIKNII